MSTLPRIPAAQYVRASTDRQEYSATNQATVIAEYAERNGFSIIKTYDDPATSGVVLRLAQGPTEFGQGCGSRRSVVQGDSRM
jgi:hypothetical protein